jgi:hypothetical protein
MEPVVGWWTRDKRLVHAVVLTRIGHVAPVPRTSVAEPALAGDSSALGNERRELEDES